MMRRKNRSNTDYCAGGNVVGFDQILQPHQQNHQFSMNDDSPLLAPSPSFWSNDCDDPNEFSMTSNGVGPHSYSNMASGTLDMDDAFHPRRPLKRPRLKMEEAFRSMTINNENDAAKTQSGAFLHSPPQMPLGHALQQQSPMFNSVPHQPFSTNGHDAPTSSDIDFSDESDAEATDPVTLAAREEAYRVAFGMGSHTTYQNDLSVVDQKIESIIRRSRAEAFRAAMAARRDICDVTETKDDMHLSGGLPVPVIAQHCQPYARNRSKSFDDLESDMKL